MHKTDVHLFRYGLKQALKIKVLIFRYLLLNLLVVGADEHVVHSSADLRGLIFAGLAGPHHQRHFHRVIRYGHGEVRIPDPFIRIRGGIPVPLQYVKVQAESDLAKGHNHGGEQLQAKGRIEHSHSVADHQVPLFQGLDLHQQERISLLVVDPPE